eukprot:5122720-Karenia_brevis.AAC.1
MAAQKLRNGCTEADQAGIAEQKIIMCFLRQGCCCSVSSGRLSCCAATLPAQYCPGHRSSDGDAQALHIVA